MTMSFVSPLLVPPHPLSTTFFSTDDPPPDGRTDLAQAAGVVQLACSVQKSSPAHSPRVGLCQCVDIFLLGD